MQARYKELLLPYGPLRQLHLARRAVLLFELIDPFQSTLPCWKSGGSTGAETLTELVRRITG